MKALLLVLNEFTHDSRVLRQAETLTTCGYEVAVFALHQEGLATQEDRPSHRLVRFALWTRSWPRYRLIQVFKYVECVLRMTWRAGRFCPLVVHANDLDSLPVGLLVKALFGARLVYDAHELWFDVYSDSFPAWMARLMNRMERVMARRADCVVTVCDGIARHMSKNLGIAMPIVVRNIPSRTAAAWNDQMSLRLTASFHADRHILLSVGMVCPGRGIETLLRAMPHVDESAGLVFLGNAEATVKCADGRSYLQSVQALARELGVEERVRFLASVPPEDVHSYTAGATIGLALIEPKSLSYYLCLPNKLFQYVHAGVPVVVSDLPEMARVVRRYDLGEVVPPGNHLATATAINFLLRDPSKLARYRENARRAALDLNWEREQVKLVTAYQGFLAAREPETAHAHSELGSDKCC